MPKYKSKTKTVEAWQHQPRPDDETRAWPRFVMDLAAAERIRDLPDGSIHVTDEDGMIMPLPINYWLVLSDDGVLSVVAPDLFAVLYSEV